MKSRKNSSITAEKQTNETKTGLRLNYSSLICDLYLHRLCYKSTENKSKMVKPQIINLF